MNTCPINVVDTSLESLWLVLSVAYPLGVRLKSAQVFMEALRKTFEIPEKWRWEGRLRVRNFGGIDLLVTPGAKPKVRVWWLMWRWKALTVVYGTHISLWEYHSRRRFCVCIFMILISTKIKPLKRHRNFYGFWVFNYLHVEQLGLQNFFDAK